MKLLRQRPEALPAPPAEEPDTGSQEVALQGEVLPATDAATSRHHMTSRQLRHLAESARLEERPDHAGSRLAIWTICGSLLSFLFWASFATLPEVARAPGEIRPLGLERAVQLPSGGTLEALAVRDGDQVTAGQVIARLDDQEAQADLRIARQQIRSLALQEEWMEAFIEGRPPDFSGLSQGTNDPELRNAQQTYEARVASMRDRRRVLREQISQIDSDLAALRGQITSQDLRVSTSAEVLDRQETLFERGLLVFSSIVGARQALADARAQLNGLQEQERATLRQREEVIARLDALESSERVSIREMLQTARADMASTRAQIENIQETIENRLIRASSDGTVTLPEDLSPGDFIFPGSPMAFIVPADADLVARIRVPSDDISRVSVGQAAEIKVSALDFTRFGRVSGTVQTLSPSALVSETGEIYYSAEIQLDGNSLTDGVETFALRPGMLIEAEILNGSRTILAYLFKPVKQALDNAFKEE